MHLESMACNDTQVWEGHLMNFGERVRSIRTQQGLSAKELSARSNVPEKTIYRIETGEVADPKLSTIELLVKALNCSADELLFDKDSFSKLAQLRRYFLNFTELDEYQQTLLLDVIQKLILAMSFENQVSIGMERKYPQKDPQP